MAAKNTLKYKRNRLRPLLDLANVLIDYCLDAITKSGFKASLADLITLIRMRLDLDPIDPAPPTIVWGDDPAPG